MNNRSDPATNMETNPHNYITKEGNEGGEFSVYVNKTTCSFPKTRVFFLIWENTRTHLPNNSTNSVVGKLLL